MRSSRATELIEEYPAHMVNAWLGHTEAVAMAHYRQTTGKAADKFYDQAAGIGKNTTPQKNVAKTVAEHAGIGCFGVDAENSDIATTPCISTTCDDMQDNAKEQNSQKWRGQDSNLRP